MEGADGIGNFTWLFESGHDAFYTALLASSGTHEGLLGAVSGLTYSALFLGLILIVVRAVFGGGDVRNTFGSLIICVPLLSPTTIQVEGRAPIPAVNAQWALVVPLGTIYSIFTQAIRGAEPGTALLVEDLGARQAQPFAGSDLAALMQDYQRYCQPLPDISGVSTEAWQAVGLKGGGGLGVPDGHLQIFSEETISKARDKFFGWFGTFRSISAITGAWSAGNRREEGVAALQRIEGQWPANRTYALPSEGDWSARFGKSDGQAAVTESYLDPRKVAGGKLFAAEGTYPDSYAGIPPFAPANCYEAYLAAQAGAEEAYRGLRSTLRPADMAASTEVSIVDGVVAWSSVVDRSMASMYGEGGLLGGVRGAAAEAVGAANGVSAFFAQLDLVTQLPRVVYTVNLGLAIAVMLIPLLVLAAIFLGFGVLLYAARLVSWGFCTLLIIELVFKVFAEQLAMSQFLIAAQSVAMSGVATDVAGNRGVLLMLISGLIAGAVSIAGRLFGVMSMPTAGDLGTSVTNVLAKGGSLAMRAMGMKAQVTKEAARKLAAQQRAGRNGRGGPPGSGGPAGATGSSARMAVVHAAAAANRSNMKQRASGEPKTGPRRNMDKPAEGNIVSLVPPREGPK
jgi:hypothetical protein